MRRTTAAYIIVGAALATAVAIGQPAPGASQEATPAAGPAVEAALRDPDGGEVGTVRLSEVITEGVQVAIDLEASGIAPGEHGVRILERGECPPAGDDSAAGRDLLPIDVGDDGAVSVVIPTDGFTLEELDDADGSALVILANRDDRPTDPDGAGDEPVACAEIFPAEAGATSEAGTPGPEAPVAEAIATAWATAVPGEASPEADA